VMWVDGIQTKDYVYAFQQLKSHILYLLNHTSRQTTPQTSGYKNPPRKIIHILKIHRRVFSHRK